MSTISRKIPATNPKRRLALLDAFAKLENPGINGIIIRPATQSRLVSITPQYNSACNQVNQKKALAVTANAQKNKSLSSLRLLVKHFVGVFNFGVERGEYAPFERAFFGIDVNNSNLPDLGSESAVKALAEQITLNDAARLAAGGRPMTNPSAAEVLVALNAYNTDAANASVAYEFYDKAQETLSALNSEANKVIKKVWDEVETFYNEESVESMRGKASEWGVQYIIIKPPSKKAHTLKDFTVLPAA